MAEHVGMYIRFGLSGVEIGTRNREIDREWKKRISALR